jgi:dipeptidyl-peptidase 4
MPEKSEQKRSSLSDPASILERYVRAESFLEPNAEALMRNVRVEPVWIDNGQRFVYTHETVSGLECRVVDLQSGASELAFDHERMASALSSARGVRLGSDELPLLSADVSSNLSLITFNLDDRQIACEIASYDCALVSRTEAVAERNWSVESVDHNLWLRSADTGADKQLTSDGDEHHVYGVGLPSPLEAALIESTRDPGDTSAVGQWSPDGTKFLTFRMDSADAGKFGLVQSKPLTGALRPETHVFSYPLPGDETVPQSTLVIADVSNGRVVEVDSELLPQLYYGHPMQPNWVWWSSSSQHVFLIRRHRGFFAYSLEVVDAETGQSRTVITERSDVAIDPFISDSRVPLIRVLEQSSQVVWFSQRSGWGHLYLVELASGELSAQLTDGEWNVSSIQHVDEQGRYVYFTAVGREDGRDPYYDHLYRVSLDGGEPELLTPEVATHYIRFAPDGQHFLDTYSTVTEPPVTVVRRCDGTIVSEVARADVSQLIDTGWKAPQRFVAPDRDGNRVTHGVLLLPSWHDGNQPLPVLDDIYAGPHVNRVPTAFADSIRGRNAGFFRIESYWQATAIAELGFAIVMIDGAGRPGRSKQEHLRSYRNVRDGGLADHISAIQHLATIHPYLDLERVGMYGNSAGGFPTVSALLDYPDFYKVGVSSGGNHDHRLDKASWIERYMGFPPGPHYVEQANTNGVERLAGKLLLIHAEMDENVHLASTMLVVDALINANKSFDLLIMPNRPHYCTEDPYYIRRKWDYFVEHLLELKPPVNYAIGASNA